MSIFFKMLIILAIGVLIYYLFESINAYNQYKSNIDSSVHLPASSAAPQEKHYYQLSENQLLFLKLIIISEMEETLANKATMLSDYIFKIDVTAQQIATTYEDNEVKGDQKFINKIILVNGTIDSIASGLGNAPYITFSVENEWQPPHANFKKDLIEKVALLEKGQEIALVCTGGGEIAGRAILKECDFMENYIKNNTPDFLLLSNDYLKGIQPDNHFMEVVQYYLSLALVLNVIEPNVDECIRTTPKVVSNLTCLKNTIDKIPKLKEAGITTPEIHRIKLELDALNKDLASHELTTLSEQIQKSSLKILGSNTQQ